VVPVPIFVVIFLIVFDVNDAGAFEEYIPTTCDPVPVAVNWIELETVPPILFEFAVHAVDVVVFAFNT
jgi:hypothetical protein